MRLGQKTRAILVVLAAASISMQACKKEDDDDDDETPQALSAENEEDGTQASAATILAIQSFGAGAASLALTDRHKADIRAFYQEARTRAHAFTQDGDFDICSYFNEPDKCAEIVVEDQPVDEEGVSCTSSCAETGGLAQTCAMEGSELACGDDKYTLSAGVSNMLMTCVDNDDDTYVFNIDADFKTSVSGGSITTATELACEFKVAFDPNATETAAGDDSTVDCDEFSCTLGGVALSCEELQTAISEGSCAAN
jgi:hypothetical protein